MQQLQPPEDGLFLVRESARHPGDYVLCVSFGRDVIHYRVLHRDGHLTIDEAVCFCNLMDMVEVRACARPRPPVWRQRDPGRRPIPAAGCTRDAQSCVLPSVEMQGLASMDHRPYRRSEAAGSHLQGLGGSSGDPQEPAS